jgi:hypothetical protein
MALNTDRHMERDEIERYSMGAITEEESAPFDEHVLICEFCRNRVTESDDYVAAMQGAGGRLRHSRNLEARRRFFPRLIPLFSAAGLIVLVALATLWLGNRATATPAYAVNLVSTRGSGIDAKAPPGRALNLSLELTGLPTQPSFRVEMVDRLGTVVWRGTAQPRDSKAAVSVPGMPGGIYFVRVYAPPGELLREYGIEVAR